MKKDKGSGILYYIFFLALIGLVCLVASYVIKMKYIGIINEDIQDAVSLSNLAAAQIDKEIYNRNGTIQVKDFNEAYYAYEEALIDNLNLSMDRKPMNNEYIQTGIDILEFSVYNVVDLDITQIRRSLINGIAVTETIDWSGQLGELKTPDGVNITNTTVYSRVGFTLKGFMNDSRYVYKEGCIDIVDQE